MVAKFLGYISSFFQNLFSVSLDFLGDLFKSLFDGLIVVLKAIFKPILIVVALIFYFVYKVGELVVMLVKVLLAIGKLLYSFVMGLFKTLGGLIWTPAPPNHGAWSKPIQEVFLALEPYQLNKIAYVLMFIIWVLTAVGAIRLLSARGGGDG
ncbi:hypothetical protein [Paenibacillus sp. GCM10027626]|uniref:hypothetical protein n=1 Tax=Paenibacillus sp. GCM10027626 TaxID=3273411 RepID=UPI00363DC1D6